MHLVARMLAYAWASPATALGLLGAVAAVLTGGRAGVVDGVLEAHGGVARGLLRICLYGPAAMTLGHIVIGQDAKCLEWTRAHERVHVRQYERWGPFFIPAYLLASLAALLAGRHPYRDNAFEREAEELAVITPPRG